MNGQTLNSIIIDQDVASLVALSKALPNTVHFLCIWHINQNVVKHLGHLLGNGGLKKGWSKLLFSHTVLDFEGA